MSLNTISKKEYTVITKYFSLFRSEIATFLSASIAIVDALENTLVQKDKSISFARDTIYIKKTRQDYHIDFRPLDHQKDVYHSPENVNELTLKKDFRSDFYSLGILFYEILTDTVPTMDSHGHIQLQRSKIPPYLRSLFLIVEKLLSYYPQDRYQSHFGLRDDLQRCLSDLKKTGEISHFFPGQSDIPTQLEFGNTLYGREKEEALLKDIFQGCRLGRSGFVLVNGPAGIGKTFLIETILKKEKFLDNSIFLEAKFDQQGASSYSGIVTILDALANVISQNKTNGSRWTEEIRSKLNENSRILSNFVPRFKGILGDQPPLVFLNPTVEKTRLYQTIQDVFRVFSQEAHPVLIFLDDLQWVDKASMTIIQVLIKNIQSHFLVVGAYRDNECSSTHPLINTIDVLKKSDVFVKDVSLDGLTTDYIQTHLNFIFKQIPLDGITNKDISEQVEDLLSCGSEKSRSLAEVLYEKTFGNPFYTKQILVNLKDKQLIWQDLKTHEWQWELHHIKEEDISDNVLELITQQLHQLPVKTIQLLKICTCIESTFDLKKVADIMGKDVVNLDLDLWHAMHRGIIIALSKAEFKYKFSHDKLQQVFLDLMSAEEKEDIHLTIGRGYLKQTSQTQTDVREAISHLNLIFHRLSKEEKQQVISLNETYARMMTESSAYSVVFDHYSIALDQLEQTKIRDEERLFELKFEQATAAFLSTQYRCAEQLFDALEERNLSPQNLVRVVQKKIDLLNIQYKYDGAMMLGIAALKRFNKKIVLSPTKIDIIGLLIRINRRIKAIGGVQGIQQLPKIHREKDQAVIDLLFQLATPAYFYDKKTYAYVVLHIFLFSLHAGISYVTPFALLAYASIVSSKFRAYDKAITIGQVGLDIDQTISYFHTKAKVLFMWGGFVSRWNCLITSGIGYLDDAIIAGKKSGDLNFVVYSMAVGLFAKFFSGMPLTQVSKVIEEHMPFVLETGYIGVIYDLTISKCHISLLTDNSDARTLYVSDQFDERIDREKLRLGGHTTPEGWFYICKLQLLTLFDQYEEAYPIGKYSEGILDHLLGFSPIEDYYFYFALVLLNLTNKKTIKLTKGDKKTIKKSFSFYARWAKQCPENYLSRYYILKAKKAETQNKELQAMSCYQEAITAATKHQQHHIAAIASEYAWKLLKTSNVDLARDYFQKSKAFYDAWGATALVDKLDRYA